MNKKKPNKRVNKRTLANAVRGRPFARYKPTANSKKGETGFVLSGLKEALIEFVEESTNEKSITLGWFITFKSKNGEAKEIKELLVNKLILKLGPEPSTAITTTASAIVQARMSWLMKLYAYDGELYLDRVNLTAVPKKINHFQGDSDTPASPDSMKNELPSLQLTDASADASVEDLRGYRDSIRVAYLNHATLWQMHMVHERMLDDRELEFVFSGAEINYGEMVSPVFQHERYRDWGDRSGPDPSLSFTLKVESVAKLPRKKNKYEYVSILGGALTKNAEIKLPGLFLLLTCKRYWEATNAILGECASTLGKTKNDKEVEAYLRVAKALSINSNVKKLLAGVTIFISVDNPTNKKGITRK